MRRLFVFSMMTLDGFFEGPRREIDWHTVGPEFNDFAVKQLDELDTLLFGRVTWQLMAAYWPTESAIRNDPVVAGKMNGLEKVVFSRTLASAAWSNSRLVTGDAAEEVGMLKKQPGRDMAIFGSARLAASLTAAGLVDELRIMVNPVILGAGTPLFGDVREKRVLELLEGRAFKSGNVLLRYAFRR